MFGSKVWLCTAAVLSGCTEKAPPATDRADEAETESPPPASDTDEDAGETGEAESSRCSAWGAPDVVATVSDPELDEISGLVVSRRHAGVLWVHEDSGAGPVLTALTTDGASLATLTLRDASSVDWEDLAIAPCGEADCLWVGDFGDNSERRTDVQLLRVQEPDLSVVGGALEASVTAYPYAYTEGPQDAEALVVTPTGQPYVLTKRTDATSHIYRVPTSDSTIAERVATISTGTTDGLPTATTAADLWPDGTRLLVRGYLYSFELTLGPEGLAGADSATHTAVTTGVELQGEAIAYDAVGQAIWHIGEGVNPPIWRIPCAD